jgi:hypothetical protein
MTIIIDGTNGISGVDGSAGTPAYVGNDSDTGLWYPAANTVALSTSGSERLRIDSSGNVGIGNTPSGTSATGYRSLELGTTAGTGITAGNGDLYVPVNAYVAGGAWKYAVTGQTASLFNAAGNVYTWSQAASGTAGNNISFSERMRIPAAGGLQVVNCVSVGNATPANSGAGITFPASQSDSSDANTLDDYEEGTWTPVGNGITYSTADGSYTKIGRVVTARFTIVFPSTGSGSLARVSGLPFTTTNTGTDPEFGGAIAYTNLGSSFVVFAFANTTTIQFSDFSGTGIQNATFSAKSVRAVITYFV